MYFKCVYLKKGWGVGEVDITSNNDITVHIKSFIAHGRFTTQDCCCPQFVVYQMKVVSRKIIGHDQLLFKSGPLYQGTRCLHIVTIYLNDYLEGKSRFNLNFQAFWSLFIMRYNVHVHERMGTTFSAFWKSGKIKTKLSSLDLWKVNMGVETNFLFSWGNLLF